MNDPVTAPPRPGPPPPPASIAEVLARLRAIDAALPEGDGVACFNRMYLRVTESIAARIGEAYFADDAYVARMDVVFAGYYLNALNALNAGDAGANEVPRCWAPLFEARGDARVAPLAFALAGMNAHINHDLARTVLDLAEERGVAPARGSAEHADFLRVNAVLGATIDAVKAGLGPRFAASVIGTVDAATGRADDAVALFSVAHAREAAWTGGETLWALRHAPSVAVAYEESLDRLVGMASRAMLAIAHGVG
jgi:hypothetical protein